MKLFKKNHVTKLEETIEAKLDELNTQLATVQTGSEEEVKILDDVDFLTKTLTDIKVRNMQGKEKKLEPQVKAALITTIGGAIASIAGIIIIRDYEAEDGLFTSSAKNFIKKLY
nr:MAG TPA: hemolysin [Caudoviricetes sp.]